MKTQILKEEELIGKTVLGIKIDWDGGLIITFTDGTFILFKTYSRYDSDPEIECNSYPVDILDRTNALIDLGIVTLVEVEEYKIKKNALFEKKQKENEYNRYLQLKAKYEKENK